MLIRVDPTGTLKTANASVHDITHDGLLDTLGIIKGLDVGEVEKWEKLAILVTGGETISQWKGDDRLVQSTCKDLRDQ